MNYSTKTLGQICDEVGGKIRTGPFGSQLHESDYLPSGLPVIMPKNIIDGKVDTTDIAFIGEEDENRLREHKLCEGDIVYGRRGDIGRRAYIGTRENGWLCGTGCIRISIGNKILDPKFLFYYLGEPSVIAWIKNQAIGATLPNLNSSIIRSIKVRYPPLPIQQRIASILTAYDDLIENNTRRIQILEEMAQAIYREWFVHFRFPGHDGVRMVDSGTELGQVPEGWEVKKLGDVIELAYGKGLKQEERTDGDVPVYGSSGIVGYHSEALVKGPGIIVGRKGNVGSVFWSDSNFYPIDTTFYVVSNLSPHYIYHNLQFQNFINNDAAVPGLSRNQAYLLPLLVPPSSIVTNFDEINSLFFRQLKNLRAKNNNLKKTRDLLLPKLISGQMDVSNLEILS